MHTSIVVAVGSARFYFGIVHKNHFQPLRRRHIATFTPFCIAPPPTQNEHCAQHTHKYKKLSFPTYSALFFTSIPIFCRLTSFSTSSHHIRARHKTLYADISSCHQTIRIQNSRVRSSFLLLMLLLPGFLSIAFTPVDLCSFAAMQCAYYTSVVRKKDRRDNCENKQCIKCSTKILFHHIICIKAGWKKSERLEKRCRCH